MNGFVLKNNPHIGFFFPEGFQMKRSGNLVMLAVDMIGQTGITGTIRPGKEGISGYRRKPR